MGSGKDVKLTKVWVEPQDTHGKWRETKPYMISDLHTCAHKHKKPGWVNNRNDNFNEKLPTYDALDSLVISVPGINHPLMPTKYNGARRKPILRSVHNDQTVKA